MTSDIPTPEACDLVEPLQFEPHYPPLADFFISTNTDRRIRRLMSRLGATAVRRRDHDVYLWGFPEGQHLFAGFGVIDGRLAKGPVSLRAAPATLGVGSYVLIDLSSGTTAVSADPGGNHVLYHGLGTVTNRLHLAALVHQLINYSSALSTAHSNHMFCQQFGTLSTPIAGISITLPGDRLRVRERVELDRDSMDDFSPLTPDEYRDFIAKGAADLIENVTAIVKGPYPVLCDITGGQDSRVVLGALVAAGLTKEVVFHTRFSEDAAILTATVNNREAIRRKRADLEIGAALVNHFGGSFEPRPTPDGYQPTSVAESLRLRRSQRFGSYHFMNGQILSQRRPVRKVPYIRLSGQAAAANCIVSTISDTSRQ